MVAAIRQQVTVQPGGVIEVRSPELTPGAQAEVIVLLTTPPVPTSGETSDTPKAGNGAWRRHAGALHGGDPNASNNERIDADLAREYGNDHEPPA